MKARFVQFEANNGFDAPREDVEYPIQMVRLGKTKKVILQGGQHSWKLGSRGDPAASYAFTGSDGHDPIVTLTGRQPGTMVLYAEAGPLGQTPMLLVRVYDSILVWVNFYFVQDQTSKTRRHSSNVISLLETATNLFLPQANVCFAPHNFFNCTGDNRLNLDFSTKNQSSAEQRRIWQTLARERDRRDPSASHRHVFCVRNWNASEGNRSGPSEPHDANWDTYGSAWQNIIVLEDTIPKGKNGLTLAHELGHTLGLAKAHGWVSHNHQSNALMYYQIKGGRKLYQDEVKHMHRSW